ncbi:MAG: hypothetical protein JWN99_1873 [Ilumatobacteraceae bacterium]|nr:hypothetical protein [Ilumatobacteraceae bacterium]
MSRLPGARSAVGWKRGVGGLAGLALVSGVFVAEAGPGSVSASSHREAPLIAGDPRADNTDVYAFTSPDKPDTVTLISDWIPFEEPNGGPNFYPWADDTQYNIKIDNDGDAVADLTYTWVFTTHYRDPNGQFLTNTGQVTSLDDTDLNQYQTYNLTLTNNDTNVVTTLLTDAPAAPSIAGAASMPDYTPLRDQAIRPLPNNGGSAFVGQADDPFFLDLRVFDLLYGGNATELGTDTLAGYNVNSVALQVPKSALAINGDATRNPVVGIWSTTDRRSARAANGNGTPPPPLGSNPFVQVSRLGNPLVNEVVIPLALKDTFNATTPAQDHTEQAVVDKVQAPVLADLLKKIYGVNVPPAPRNDLSEIFLQGISKANAGINGDPATVLPVDLNSQDLNKDAFAARGNTAATPAEMLRLNMSVPVTAKPNSYGVLAGDVQGFPNGRRLTDDVVDIEVQAVAGATVTGKLVAGLAAVDSVDRNDHAFGATFPYLALPNVDNVNDGSDRSPRAPEFIPINPQRVLETRTGQPSGQLGYTGAKPAAGSTVKVKVTGIAGSLVPTDAKAVYLNVTSVNADDTGYVTVFPCGTPQPVASSFNPIAGSITQNLVAAPIGADGTVCLFTNVSTDLIADIAGYHPSDSTYVATQPERLLETRTTEPGGQKGYSGAKPGDGSVITLHVTGTGAAQVPADASAVYLNVTAVNSSTTGFATVYPCGTTPPNASNVNFVPGTARSTLVVAKVGTGGNVCLFSSKSTDLVADLQGYAPASSPYIAAVPERLLDTRTDAGGQIGYSGAKPIAGQTIELKVTGAGKTAAPGDAGAVLLNITATENTGGGFVTVFPCGSARPLASNLNLTGVDTPNLVAAKVGDGGRVCIYTSGATHLVADIEGFFPDTMLVGS